MSYRGGCTAFIRDTGITPPPCCGSCHEDAAEGYEIVNVYGDWENFGGPEDYYSICCTVSRKWEEKGKPKPRTPIERLEEIYACLPDLECKGRCVDSCGPIVMTKVEADRIEEKLGREIGDVDPKTLSCPLLGGDGRCIVYEIRPLICRMWGAAVGMECSFGCEPSRILPVAEGAEIFRNVETTVGPIEVATFSDDLLRLLKGGQG